MAHEEKQMAVRTIEGSLQANGGKYAIVAARWNSFVVESLVRGALDSLVRHGIPEEDITLVRCPGAIEIPLVVKKVAKSGKYDAVIALGAVIRGGTPHFDFVANECAKGTFPGQSGAGNSGKFRCSYC